MFWETMYAYVISGGISMIPFARRVEQKGFLDIRNHYCTKGILVEIFVDDN